MVDAMELWGVIGSQIAGMPELAEQVRRWEEVRVAGVFASDHLFFDMKGSRRTARRQPDPYVLLAAAGAVTNGPSSAPSLPTPVFSTCVVAAAFFSAGSSLRR